MRKKINRMLNAASSVEQLRRDVDQLQIAVEESRRLNERLSDVLDVVVELLVPAVDRNEERLAESLKKL